MFYTVHRTDVFCLFDVASTYAVVIEVVSRGIVLVLAYVVKEEGHAGFFLLFSSQKGYYACFDRLHKEKEAFCRETLL